MQTTRKGGKAGTQTAGQIPGMAAARRPEPAPAGLRVLVVSPEIVPLAKTGGLADVAGSLPLALKDLGCDVRVAMPLYRCVRAPRRRLFDVQVPMGPKFHECVQNSMPAPRDPAGGPPREATSTAGICAAELRSGIPAYLVDNPALFDRDSLYGYGDDAARFGFFCRALLESFGPLGWEPELVHCNDWQSAMVPTYLKLIYKPDGKYSGTGTLFTIHNVEYQGNFDPGFLEVLGLGRELYNMEAIEFYGQLSLMKAGILFSDMVNTVSESYSQEIRTPSFGGKMDGVLRANGQKLRGIVNGLDYEVWDPERDMALEQRFGPATLASRSRNKAALQNDLGLDPDPGAFLLGFVGRLTIQKGIDILLPAVPELLGSGCQLAALGTGDQHYMDRMAETAGADPERLAVMLKFDDRMARRIYGGCDAFLMPSQYEPCGLGQLIGLRYGAVPIVRRVGGLKDTVREARSGGDGTGFIFDDYVPEALVDAVAAARQAYSNADLWKEIVLRGMTQDFSWKASAGKYLQLYHELRGRPQP